MKKWLANLNSNIGLIFWSTIKSKAFWKTCFWAFTTAGFMMFIVEETMQVRGFGRYGLQQGKLWQEAATAANYSVGAMRRDRTIIKILSVLNPPAGYVFGRYVDAEEKKLGWEMKRIESELQKLNTRVKIIENELRIRPVSLIPETLTDISPLPARMPKPTSKLSYPKQIDYQTHDQRLNRSQDAVYLTKYGSKFHRPGCGSIKGRGARKVGKAEAVGDGKTPCLRCKP